jgi:hypothetical protein
MRYFIAIMFMAVGLICCKIPNTTVQTVDGSSRLKVVGAPSGTLLYLDGNQVGRADSFAGDPNVLSVEPGTHLIEVKKDGVILLAQRVFFGGGEMRSVSIAPEVK